VTQRSAATGLIGLLDTFALKTESAVRQRVVDTAAENYEAELVAIVSTGAVTHSTGLGGSASLEQSVVGLAAAVGSTANPAAPGSATSRAELGGLGLVDVASLPVDDDDISRFVLIRTAGPFDPDELRGCRAMIRIMRLAIRTIDAFDEQVRVSQRLAEEVELNRQLADELQQRHTEFMARILDLQGMLTASTGPVLESVVRQAEELMPGDVVVLQLLRPDGMLELAQYSANAPDLFPTNLGLVQGDQGLAGLAIERNELVVTTDYQHHGRALPSLVAAGITATITAPVRRRNEVVGALTVSSHDPERHFTRDEIETILLLAGYASVALTDALTLDQRQKALEEAEWQATHDPLTGLANRRLVMDTITDRLSTKQGEMNVLYIDVDRFKSVNDRYGHHVGDLLIKEVAERIKASTRADDLVGRLAGDEFIVVFGSQVELSQASRIAERIRQRLNGPALLAGHSVPLSVSIGIATSEGVISADDVINAADVAMYQAKSGGRNQVGRYNRSLQTKLRNQAELAERLEIAITDGSGLHLEYQPIVEIETETVVGHEALLRWVDPMLGQVPPDTFIPVAEQLGMITRIDDWVLATAIAEAAAAGNQGRLSVNVSPAWLEDPGVADKVAAIAATHRFPLRSLALEVTERVALAENVTAVLGALRAIGVRILLDDFGTGYSSLAYVQTLEIDGIKIDRGFLQGVETDRHAAAILEAVVTLTDRLGALAIAEGVESPAQAGLLMELGCKLAQGFYFGRPKRAPAGLFPLGSRVRVGC
jgi:diguanylate cyclase (GGDEF)-like protein